MDRGTAEVAHGGCVGSQAVQDALNNDLCEEKTQLCKTKGGKTVKVQLTKAVELYDDQAQSTVVTDQARVGYRITAEEFKQKGFDLLVGGA